MSGFSAAWLTLREGYDLAARNRAVLGAVAGAFVEQTAISVVDLGCGTGSTLRAIADHLPPRQSWRLIDNDLGLLARAATLPRPPHVNVVTKPIDLVSDLELAIEGPLDLVTTSALLDLVSLEWLDRLVIEAAARRLPVYAALTYDGRVVLEPSEGLDPEVLARFHAHQRADKGFGPALGPTAAARAVERFEHFGYAVVQGRSDWVLKPADLAIQEALFAGWAESGALSAALSSDHFAAWLSQRRSHLAVGRSNLRVGHLDIFARPTGVR
jgi:SAM-dependent methyltransferase